MNRVAITGLGVISPVGQDIETVYANLRDGVCGVGRITRFDPAETKISVAAEVKDFDPEAFGISRGDTRRMDLFTQYATRSRVRSRPWTTAASSAPSPRSASASTWAAASAA